MKRLVFYMLIISLLLSGCGVMKEYSLEVDPFAHTYRVVEVLETDTPDAAPKETLLINIDAFRNLYIMDDTTTYDFQSIGELKKSDLPEGDTRKALWLYIGASDRYELSVEADDAVILTYLLGKEVAWSYRLSRVDMISAHISSAGTRSHMDIGWYFADTFSGSLLQLPSRPHILKKGTMGFSTEDDSITSLTLLEAYYTDGNAEYREYTLTKEDGFSMDLNTRYETGEQYAIYRIPHENGEYVFCLKYA